MAYIKYITTACLAILFIGSILAACTTSESDQISSDSVAKQVGVHYGDSHVQVSGVTSTTSEGSPGEPMYLMTIVGNFHKNGKTAHSLSFSALADKKYAWNIHAFDQQGKEVWWDMDFAHPQA